MYVHSNWRPGTGSIGVGLARLGRWASTSGQFPSIDISDPKVRLVDADQPIAHVALVYAHLEQRTAAIGPLATITSMAALSLGQYTSAAGLARMAFSDVAALLQHHDQAPTPSLQVREDSALG